ncbi:DUF4242 domain-containing protein [Gallaecimonas sp. GXIMD4217]|uniref:DUF4242 domain-containing protein n=1 Tax=Gallaecimonas sp. GXIMD4217 TaxID=3131927 RepID=UPI00311B3F99
MALFIIEREFAEQLELDSQAVRQTLEVNEEIGVQWLFSFLSADKKKTYCLYEAKDPALLREHARVLGIPADVIVEVTQLEPEALLQG